MPTFQSDLQQEQLLSQYLDTYYTQKELNFRRITDHTLQHQGVDVILKYNDRVYNIDEKAQLHYLNKDLPTFTFELSYLKNNQLKQGWLFDEKKTTDYYFLITGIMLNCNKTSLDSLQDIKQLKITSVNRKELINFLAKKGLSQERLNDYNNKVRNHKSGKIIIPELNPKTEGVLYTSNQLDEAPVNLQLRLQYILDNRVAKKI